MSVTALSCIAIFLMVIGYMSAVIFDYHDGWFLPVILPIMLFIIGISIFFTPAYRAGLEADRLAAEKQQQEIEARNNRCIEDLSKRYNLLPETIKFLMDNGKIPCPPVN